LEELEMSIHREIFNDLPPAEDLERMYAEAFATQRDADGYYIFVQSIAERFGERAYALAEEVFRQEGMKFDPAGLRAVDRVRRPGYNNDGINIYHLEILPFAAGMARDLTRLYNREVRGVSRQWLLNEDQLLALADDGLLAASNEAGQAVGMVHCRVDPARHTGSVEALIFSPGRVYQAVARDLVRAAREYFAARQVKHIQAYAGWVSYPYAGAPNAGQRLAQLEHIASAMDKIIAADG
jgi:hypothetical protein